MSFSRGDEVGLPALRVFFATVPGPLAQADMSRVLGAGGFGSPPKTARASRLLIPNGGLVVSVRASELERQVTGQKTARPPSGKATSRELDAPLAGAAPPPLRATVKMKQSSFFRLGFPGHAPGKPSRKKEGGFWGRFTRGGGLGGLTAGLMAGCPAGAPERGLSNSEAARHAPGIVLADAEFAASVLGVVRTSSSRFDQIRQDST